MSHLSKNRSMKMSRVNAGGAGAGRLVGLVQRSVCYVTSEDLEIEFRVAGVSRGEGHQSGLG